MTVYLDLSIIIIVALMMIIAGMMIGVAMNRPR